MGTKNFKSAAAYKKYLAYGHATKVFEKTPGSQKIKIHGSTHKVHHGGKK